MAGSAKLSQSWQRSFVSGGDDRRAMDIVVFSLGALTQIFTAIAFATPVAERFRPPLPVAIAAVGLAGGYVLLTLLVNAATLRYVASSLGLDRLSKSNRALREQIVAGTMADVRNNVSGLAADRLVEPGAVDEMRAAYEPQIRDSIEQSETTGVPFGERLRLGLKILANQELRLVQLAFEEEAIGSRVARQLRP